MFRFGLIMLATRASGIRTKPMEEVNSGMLTVTFTMESGEMIRQMGTESICMSMELLMKGSGKTICKKVKESRVGLTVASTRVIIKLVLSMEMDSTSGLMAHLMTENGTTTASMGTDATTGQMVDNT